MFWTSGLSSLTYTGLQVFGNDYVTLGGGILVGGVVSNLSGGSFWDGIRDAAIAVGLNRLIHEDNSGGKKNKDKLKGGKQNQRDHDIKQYPKEFQKWYHREVKPYVHPGRNAAPEELEEGYQDWLDEKSSSSKFYQIKQKPSINLSPAKVGMWTLIGIGVYEGIKWTSAVLLAPETGGLSLGAAGGLP